MPAFIDSSDLSDDVRIVGDDAIRPDSDQRAMVPVQISMYPVLSSRVCYSCYPEIRDMRRP